MPETFSLAQVFDDVLREKLAEVRVSLPAEVVSYDSSKREAEVKLRVKRRLEDEEGNEVEEDYPPIPHVRVCFPQGGGFHASFPLQAGDNVMLVFADVSLDDLRAGRLDLPPSDRASHHLANAWCYPGALDPDDSVLGGASDTDLVIGQDGGPELAIDGSKVKLGGRGASDPVLRKSEYDSLKTWLEAHTHTETGGETKAPTNNPAPTASGASKVTAE